MQVAPSTSLPISLLPSSNSPRSLELVMPTTSSTSATLPHSLVVTLSPAAILVYGLATSLSTPFTEVTGKVSD